MVGMSEATKRRTCNKHFLDMKFDLKANIVPIVSSNKTWTSHFLSVS